MTIVTLRIASRAALALAFLVLALAPNPTHAHAILVSSTPKDKAVVKNSPAKVILNFDSRIEKRVSQVILRNQNNRRVPLRTPPGGYKAGKSNQLIVPLPSLKPGTYRLEYRILATDGHLTPGEIRFTISGGKPH